MPGTSKPPVAGSTTWLDDHSAYELLVAAVVGLVGAGVDEHDVVEHTVGLEQVAVTVEVALVLDVVVGEGEVGVGVVQRLHGVDGHLAGAPRVVGVADVAGRPGLTGVGRVPRLGVREHQPGLTVPLTSYLPLDISR